MQAGENRVPGASEDPEVGWRIGEIVDLERYPLEQNGSDDYWRCVESVRDALATNCCAVLDGFIRADRI
jgi:hypothetical protein